MGSGFRMLEKLFWRSVLPLFVVRARNLGRFVLLRVSQVCGVKVRVKNL